MVSPLVAMNCKLLSTTITLPLVTTHPIVLSAVLVIPLLAWPLILKNAVMTRKAETLAVLNTICRHILILPASLPMVIQVASL